MDENMQREADEIEKMTLSDEDAEALVKAMQEALQETPEDDELPPSMEEEHQAVMELTRWLDDQLK
jgi:DNA-binding transcriptional regulator GbsR (MarR family)